MTYRGSPVFKAQSQMQAGLRAHRAGQLDQAVAAYREALRAAPEHGEALNLLGTALLQLGHAEEAVSCLERAVRKQRENAPLLANLAQAYLATGRHQAACDAFVNASRIQPDEVQFHVGAAAGLALQGRLGEAEALLNQLATRFPKAPLVWLNLGNVLRDQRSFEPAMDAYRTALGLDPAMIEARNAIGSVLHSLLRFAEAEREYRACVEAAPAALVPRYNLASVTMDMGRFAEAEAVSREIAAIAPDLPEAHRLVGTALAFQGRLLDALAWYQRAARLAPNDVQTTQTYGTALMEAGHAAAGLRWLSRAAALDSKSIALKRVTAGALLAHGCLQDAWKEHGHRPAAGELRAKHRTLHLVRSLPQSLHGKHVCVLAEQGLGDELFFLRYVALVVARGARVSYRGGRKLCSLLDRVSDLDAALPEDADLPPADAYVLAGDLPEVLTELPSSALPGAGKGITEHARLDALRRRIALFWPLPAPTLRIMPRAEQLTQLREHLAIFGPPPYIGVTWRGGTAPEKQGSGAWLLYKSIALSALASTLERVPCTVIALQREAAPGEIEMLSGALRRPVHDLTALNDDLEAMLALLTLIDEYVGVSNTNMHLRAAAGRTARVLVPVPAEWRWMQSGRASPWFPGFSIYRQSLQGDWTAALAALRNDLETRYACAPSIRHAESERCVFGSSTQISG